MKKICNLGLCALLILGLAVSAAPAAQDKETQDVVQDDRSSAIKELTIRNSGFRSRSTIVIRYREKDKKIVEVIENGKKLSPSEFSRYESAMRKILELPQIDRLLPEIDRARRRAESPRVSEESKIREMLELRRRLNGLESDVARRYRDLTELQLMNQLNRMTEKISESDELSQQEKIQQIKEVLEKIHAMERAKKEGDRRRRLAEIETANVARRLIAEINKSEDLSREDKIKEIQELLQRSRAMDLMREERRQRDLVEFEAANTMRRMLQDIAKQKDLSDQEREKEFQRVLQEAEKMQSESMKRMIGIEKFKFDLHLLLKKEGLLPEGKAEFILRSKECLINGKKLPDIIHEKILQLCEESIGKKFERDTKIILQLNEDS
ncbi:MAG: hypothetical protein JSV17_12430 [Candidatus Aminicenantes bacterium]|nr:MAG: hypothetical protein JSV17_12430 [Candidatus Aminicenantes bacterium]